MAIVMDTPHRYPKYGLCAHLFSDLPGEAGHEELLAFARKIGLKQSWLQKEGTYREHFDVMRSIISKAEESGARRIDKYEFCDILKKKRAT